ncbi:MAG: antitoxin FitA [Actinomycetota bacterium]|jgi:hypothetical protein
MPASGQITIRTHPDLVLRVKEAAAAEGKSMNEYVEHLIEIAVDPTHATSEDERLVARLRAAGLYSEPEEWGAPVEPPDPALVEKARAAMGRGTPLSDLVSQDRGE